MKKIGLTLLALFTLMGCTESKKSSVDAIEYNNSVEISAQKADMSGYVLLEDKNHVFLETSAGEINRLFSEKGSAVVYLGYTNCPWCNRALPILNDIAKESKISIYYLDVYGDKTEGIDEMINVHLAPALGSDGLYVPFVMAIKDGVVVGSHVAMVDSYNDASKTPTDEQIQELKDIYYELFSKLK